MADINNTLAVNRKYKDTFFRMLFKEKKELLSLYNALNDSHYEDESKLEIVTLEGCIYIGMKNDLAFILVQHFPINYTHFACHNSLLLRCFRSTMHPSIPSNALYKGTLDFANVYCREERC